MEIGEFKCAVVKKSLSEEDGLLFPVPRTGHLHCYGEQQNVLHLEITSSQNYSGT